MHLQPCLLYDFTHANKHKAYMAVGVYGQSVFL